MDKARINEIDTKRLILRRFREEDLDDYYTIMKQDQVTRWLGSGKRKDCDDVKFMLQSIENHWIESNYGVWAVVRKENNELIGHCGLKNLEHTNDIELLYAYDTASWGKGYATEAAKAAIEFAITELKVHKLVALVHLGNRKSSNVIEKLGFKYKEMQKHFGVELMYYELKLSV